MCLTRHSLASRLPRRRSRRVLLSRIGSKQEDAFAVRTTLPRPATLLGSAAPQPGINEGPQAPQAAGMPSSISRLAFRPAVCTGGRGGPSRKDGRAHGVGAGAWALGQMPCRALPTRLPSKAPRLETCTSGGRAQRRRQQPPALCRATGSPPPRSPASHAAQRCASHSPQPRGAPGTQAGTPGIPGRESARLHPPACPAPPRGLPVGGPQGHAPAAAAAAPPARP